MFMLSIASCNEIYQMACQQMRTSNATFIVSLISIFYIKNTGAYIHLYYYKNYLKKTSIANITFNGINKYSV